MKCVARGSSSRLFVINGKVVSFVAGVKDCMYFHVSPNESNQMIFLFFCLHNVNSLSTEYDNCNVYGMNTVFYFFHRIITRLTDRDFGNTDWYFDYFEYSIYIMYSNQLS